MKKGILLQLFGGNRKNFSKTRRGQFRCELNIPLCGDPGTSKSQLLQYAYHLIPGSQYSSGKGSSAVGLTANVATLPRTSNVYRRIDEHARDDACATVKTWGDPGGEANKAM